MKSSPGLFDKLVLYASDTPCSPSNRWIASLTVWGSSHFCKSPSNCRQETWPFCNQWTQYWVCIPQLSSPLKFKHPRIHTWPFTTATQQKEIFLAWTLMLDTVLNCLVQIGTFHPESAASYRICKTTNGDETELWDEQVVVLPAVSTACQIAWAKESLVTTCNAALNLQRGHRSFTDRRNRPSKKKLIYIQ